MKRIFSFGIGLLVLGLSAGVARAAWEPTLHLDPSALLFGITATTPTDLVAVGSAGYLITSHNSGADWMLRSSGTLDDLNDISSASQSILFAVGNDGRIIKSTDGGLTWEQQTDSTTKNFYAIDMASPTIGTIVGEDGRIYTTGNGGLTWTSRTSNTSNDLLGVVHKNSQNVWAVGEGGKILFSTNQGVTWNSRNNTGDVLYDITFTTNVDMFAVGANGTLLYTHDSGNTWMNHEGVSKIAEGRDLYTIFASDDKTLIAAGDELIIRSTDGGDTWQEEPFTNDSPTFYDVVVSNGEMYGVGEDIVGGFVDKLQADLEEPGETTEEPVEFGQLIKTTCTANAGVNDPCKAVYYYGVDGMRHAFPNEKVFFTWYTNFDDVVEIDTNEMGAIPLGRNVTYKPGAKMVKFVTVNTVYAVAGDGSLRAIATENIAADLYGADWNTKIDDISDAFYGNYSFGAPINDANDYGIDEAMTQGDSIDDIL